MRLIYIKRRHTIRDRPVSVCVCMRTVLSIVYGLSCVSAPDRIMHSRSTRVLLVCCLLVKKIQIQLEQFRLRTRITFGHAYEYTFFQINSFHSIRPSDMFRGALFSKNWLIRFIFKIAIVYGREFVEYRSGTLFPIYRVAENVHPCLHEFTYVAPSNCFCFTWIFVDAFRRDAGNKNGVKNLKKKSLIFSFSRSFALRTNQSIRTWERDERSHNIALERDANRGHIVLPLPGRLFMELICFLTQSTTDRNKSDSPPTGCDIAYTRPTAPGKITSFIANIK